MFFFFIQNKVWLYYITKHMTVGYVIIMLVFNIEMHLTKLHTQYIKIWDILKFYSCFIILVGRSNIPSSPAYCVFISQLIRQGLLLLWTFYSEGGATFQYASLSEICQGTFKIVSLRKFYGRYGDLTKQYEVPLSRMLQDILDDDHIQRHPPLIRHYTNFWQLLI